MNASTLTATSGDLIVTPDVDPWLALCEDKLSLGLLGAGGDSLPSEERHTSPKVSAAFLRLVSKATCYLAHVLYAVKHFLHIFWRIGPMTEGSSILFSVRDFHRSTTSLARGLARDHLSQLFGRFSPHPRQNILPCTADSELKPRGCLFLHNCYITPLRLILFMMCNSDYIMLYQNKSGVRLATRSLFPPRVRTGTAHLSLDHRFF